MHPTTLRARSGAVVALALAATLAAQGTAVAATADPSTTTSTARSTASTTTPSGTTTTSGTTTPSGTTTTEPTGTSTPSGTTTTASSSTTTASPSTTTATEAPARAAKKAAPVEQVPFGVGSSLRAALVPGGFSEQATHAGGFIVRTLAARDDHYTYPASTFFDGGNTIDAVLALDGAGVGLDQADASAAFLEDNVGGYLGTDFDSVYAGPTAKALLGVTAHGGDPTAFGGLDLVEVLTSTLGAVTPGRFSDLPVDCGYPTCDYSNTIGQVLGVIALGRATGSVPDVAGDYLLDQQCADGGFRGNLDAAGAACASDVDATAFAAQALVGLLGPDDPATLRALDHLAGKQAANGGFLNQDGQYNANTAGVAAQAFAAGGYTTELARAQSFLSTLQFDCTFATGLRGGIAFTAADHATLRATPNTTAAVDRALRATPQATLGLAGDSLLTVSAEGAAATAPTLSCSATPTTTTDPAGSTSTTTTTAPAPADPASATPGNLANTGADVAAMTLLGTLLLLAGLGAIVIARRKGAHA